MKKIFNWAFGIALMTSIISCGGKKEKSAKYNGEGQVEALNQAIVFVNTDSLLKKYTYFKDVKKKLEEKGKMEEASLQAKGMAFQREVATYQQEASKMSPDQRAAIEQRLSRKQQELQQYNQTASMQLAKEEQQENEKLYQKIADFLKVYAKEKGYKMVLTYSKVGGGILYGDESLDVTEDVIEGLNAEK